MTTAGTKSSKKISAKACVFCGSSKLSDVIDFGNVALAGAFIDKKDFATEKKYPLAIVFCKQCYAVQVRDHINPSTLFTKDFYFSSAIKTLRDHFADYAAEVTERFVPAPKNALAVEFGSNDGVLLKPLAKQGIGKVIGIDPAENIVKSIKDKGLILINDFFGVPIAASIEKKYGKADIIMANNVFAHISDINGVTAAVSRLLKADGVFIFEVHYLGKIIEEMQYDMMYHEHTYYYSLLALENHLKRHDMAIFDLKPIPIHGGSIRFYAAKKGSRYSKKESSRVAELRHQEKSLGYDSEETFKNFAASIASKKRDLIKLLETLRKKQRTVVGYGASGRANTIIQYCGINEKLLDYIIDDAPAKQGLYTPGSHLQIRSRDTLGKYNPDYILLFAWAFFDEIWKKNINYLKKGGRVIVPLPDVRITMLPTETKVL